MAASACHGDRSGSSCCATWTSIPWASLCAGEFGLLAPCPLATRLGFRLMGAAQGSAYWGSRWRTPGGDQRWHASTVRSSSGLWSRRIAPALWGTSRGRWASREGGLIGLQVVDDGAVATLWHVHHRISSVRTHNASLRRRLRGWLAAQKGRGALPCGTRLSKGAMLCRAPLA